MSSPLIGVTAWRRPINGTHFVPVDNSTVKVVFEKKPREVGAEVKAGNGTITVLTDSETTAQVYSANGQLISSADVNGTHIFAAKAGAYIVKLTANGKSAFAKVAVK